MAEFGKESEGELLKTIDLCHPEMLSCAQLCSIFKQRSIPVSNCNTDKDELLALFYRTVLPLPQRDYRPTRRGQLLMSKRTKLLKKHKSNESSSSDDKLIEPPLKSLKLKGISPVRSPDAPSRLKPPPNPISAEKKTIRLNVKACNGSLEVRSNSPTVQKGNKVIQMINDTLMSNTKKSNSNGKVLTKTINSVTEDTTPPKKKHKPITWP